VWAVKGEGDQPKTYRTQREAITAGMNFVRSKTAGQLVIHGRNGQIRQHETYKMTPIKDPPKKSRSAKRIRTAVGNLALQRVQSDPHPPRERTRQK
jgi:hypothetical protein